MTKSRSLKCALLMSVLSLMLCVSMLVGSTYAWFTDSVETDKCRIQAGNLDIGLYYKNSAVADYKPVEGNTDIFAKGTLWEPGHVEVINLKVTNLGSLALKYSLGLYIAKETPGTSAKTGQNFKLSQFIEYALLDGEQKYDTNEAAILAAQQANQNEKKPLSGLKDVDTEVLKPNGKADSEKCVTLIVYMPEDPNNEANYSGTQPSIDLGISLVASQATVEDDSFGNTYDDEAKKLVPNKIAANAEDLKKVLTEATTGDVIGIAPGEYDLGVIKFERKKNITLLALPGEGEVTLKTKFDLWNSSFELYNINIQSTAQGAMIRGESTVFKMFGGSITSINDDAALATFGNLQNRLNNAKIELYNVTIISRQIDGNEGRPALSIGGENTYCYLKDCNVFGYSVFSSGTVVIEGGTFTNVKSISGYYESYNTVKDKIDKKHYLDNDEAIAILDDSRPNENIGDAIRLDNRGGNLESVVIKDVTFVLTDPQNGTNFYLFGIRYLGKEGSAPELTFENVSSNFGSQVVFGTEPQ